MPEDLLSSPISDPFDFDKLTLVERPEKNIKSLPHDLKGCVGYLKSFPVRAPSVDPRKPQSIADMVNILTNGDAESKFEEEAYRYLETHGEEIREEGAPSIIYDTHSSSVARKLLKSSKTCHVAAPGILGHLVLPGCLSFYMLDGRTYAAPQGRWLLMSYKAHWTKKNISIDQNLIRFDGSSKVLVIRVPPGGVGRVMCQGSPVLLDVGTHVYNSGTVQFAGTVLYAATNHISHDKFHYVRVERGFFAKVWAEEGPVVKARLLSEGEHFIASHKFKFNGLVSVDIDYIHHGSLHLFSIKKGTVGKVFNENHPHILSEGDHAIESSQLSFDGVVSVLDNPVINHGTITIVRVTLGQIGLAWNNNEPMFIDKPGLYEYNSNDFSFVEFRDSEDQLIQLGSRKIVLVHTGSVGVTYDRGTLKILDNGRHIIDSATHVFHRFLSTQQKSIRLASLSAIEKAKRSSEARSHKNRSRATKPDDRPLAVHSVRPESDLTICETKDLVKVGLRADVFYSIENPEKCIQQIDTDDLEDLVRETAVATLTNIIRSTALNEIAQSKQVSAGGPAGGLTVLPPPAYQEDGSEESKPSKSSDLSAFFDKAHDIFLEKLHDDFMWRYGVDISNIRIESFRIMDEELSEQISRHALTTAQIENEMANLKGNSLISTTREKTSAEVKEISSQAIARELQVKSDAENKRKIDIAKAEAEALKIQHQARAEAESEAILTKAKAEAQAIRLRAVAEAERAEMLSKTELGKQEALLGVYSNIIIESNKGVEKVIYMDPSVNRESPFAIGSLQNLNNDLHSLSQLGVAASQVTASSGRMVSANR